MRTIHWLILALILVAGTGLRIYRCARSPLSYDELGSMETAAGRGQIHLNLPRDVPLGKLPIITRLAGGNAIWSVPANMRQDVHPPLYFLMLRTWLDCFGDGDAAARSMSILLGMAGIFLIFDVGRLMANPSVGLWAAAIMALAQPQIIESQDARPYALGVTMCIAVWDLVIRIEKCDTCDWRLYVAFAIAVLAAAMSHYFTAGVLAAMLIYSAVRLRGAKRRRVFAAVAAATGAGVLIWGYGFFKQTRQPTFNGQWMYWFNDAGPGHMTRTLLRFAAVPVRYLAEPTPGSGKLMAAGAVLFALPFLLIRKRPRLLACGLWLICGAGLVTLLDLFRQTNQIGMIKYTLMAAPAVYLMLPMLLKSPHLLGAVGVLCAAVAIPSAQHEGGDWRAIAARVSKIPPDQPLVIDGAQWGVWYGPMLFMGTQRYARQLPRTIVILRKFDPPADLRQRWRGKPIWVLAAGGTPGVDRLTTGSKTALVWRDADVELFQILPISGISASVETTSQ